MGSERLYVATHLWSESDSFKTENNLNGVKVLAAPALINECIEVVHIGALNSVNVTTHRSRAGNEKRAQ